MTTTASAALRDLSNPTHYLGNFPAQIRVPDSLVGAIDSERSCQRKAMQENSRRVVCLRLLDIELAAERARSRRC